MDFNDEFVRDLLVRGIAAIKAKEVDSARNNLERALNSSPSTHQRTEALHWLSKIAETNEKKRDYIEEILALTPGDYRARRELAILNGSLPADEIIEPDSYQPAASEEHLSINTNEYKCPNCGGHMVYSPTGTGLICESCQHKYASYLGTKNSFALEENDFVIGLATAKGHGSPRDTSFFECDSCGATYILPPESLSLTCAHCDSNYTIEHLKSVDLLPPKGVIPFSISKDVASQKLEEWQESQGLGRSASIASLNGIYLPVWTFDIGGHAPYRYQEYTGNKWISNSDSIFISFDDLLVPASKPELKGFSKAVEDYDLNQLVQYEGKYLSNWLAETYQISPSDAALKARLLAIEKTKKRIRLEPKMSNQDFQVVTSEFVMQSFKLILLPVWISHIKVEDQQLELCINGQTGTIIGERESSSTLEKISDWLLGN